MTGYWDGGDGGSMPDMYLSRADGELYVVPAASAAEADAVMDLGVKQQKVLGSHTPCEPIPSYEIDGRTFWKVPA
jgi:hypothetical protein